MNCKVIQTISLITAVFCQSIFALSGTGGTPLGGMGTGYVLFDGQNIRVSSKLPPAGSDHALRNSPEKQITNSGFYLFADGSAKTRVKAASEDAKCPVQLADFGSVGDIKFDLSAFGPYWPGEGKDKYQLATSPMALFDVKATNSGSKAIDVAVALEIDLGSGKLESSNKAVSFSGNGENSYLTVDCDGESAAFSAGAEGTFKTDGKLANAAGNMVGAKCSIPAGETVHFKFVLSWYKNEYGTEGYYYHNFYKNSSEVAAAGIENFDGIRDGITGFVDRVMASNFPEWYNDRLLNNTYPLIHNSVCAKDGRTAFWEGNYGIIGTIDQGQHAAVFYSFNWPSVQWHELQYWARQQKSSGQIHHDFNQGVQSFTVGSTNNRLMKDWDDKTHPDYWWFSNTDTWADLNCMFIFKGYELMLATGDLDSLKKSWSALKKAAERLESMCGSDGIPLKSHSTYDRCNGAGDQTGSNCGLTPEYNSGLTVTSFRAMAEMAKFCDDASSATKYTELADKAQTAFKAKYGNSNTFGVDASIKQPVYGRFPEGHIAGYSWANYFCLPPIMDNDFITKTCKKMRDKQNSSSGSEAVRANGEWIFYCVDHYGGAEIAINEPDAAMKIHKLDYDYYYKSAPNMVHWQSLQEGDKNNHKDSYMTAPLVWHSYFQFCGYMIDNANKRLWIRPRIPTEMAGKITNAILPNPKAHGTLDYDENGDEATGITQTITVKYDKPVTINEIMLKNNTGLEEPYVSVSGVSDPTVKTEGEDPEKNIRVTFASPIEIGPSGIKIQVSKKPVSVANTKGFKTTAPLALKSTRLKAGTPLYFSVSADGMVKMELFSINGVKVGTIMNRKMSTGYHSFNWNGKTIDGKNVASTFAVLKLSSQNNTVAKMVSIER